MPSDSGQWVMGNVFMVSLVGLVHVAGSFTWTVTRSSAAALVWGGLCVLLVGVTKSGCGSWVVSPVDGHRVIGQYAVEVNKVTSFAVCAGLGVVPPAPPSLRY